MKFWVQVAAWLLFPSHEIRHPAGDPNGQLLMIRWRLFRTSWLRKAGSTPRWYDFEIGIHKIVAPDQRSMGLHDHPWDFFSIVLWRKYTERYLHTWPNAKIDPWKMPPRFWKHFVRTRMRGLFSIGFRRAEYLHAVTELPDGPCWTLFVLLKRRRVWGFPEKLLKID